jgi:hypothetical protein
MPAITTTTTTTIITGVRCFKRRGQPLPQLQHLRQHPPHRRQQYLYLPHHLHLLLHLQYLRLPLVGW